MNGAFDKTATLRQGPVVITGASGQIGTALRHRLADYPNIVRPVGRGDDLAKAADGAEVVVHLAGTLAPRPNDTYRAANLETVEKTIVATTRSTVRRIVFVSFISTNVAAGNHYLRYKALAEGVLRRCSTPLVILRCSHVYGPPSQPGPTAAAFLATRGKVNVLGSGRQRMSPLFISDLVDAIVHASLDPRSPEGTFELGGPEPMTADAFARILNPADTRLRHVPPPIARLLAHVVPGLTPTMVDVLLADADVGPGTFTTAALFGIELHRVSEVWSLRNSRECEMPARRWSATPSSRHGRSVS